MRLSPVILLSAAAVVSAFRPDIVTNSGKGLEWRPLSEKIGIPEVHSLKLKRQPHTVSVLVSMKYLSSFFPGCVHYPIRGPVANGPIDCDRMMVHIPRS